MTEEISELKLANTAASESLQRVEQELESAESLKKSLEDQLVEKEATLEEKEATIQDLRHLNIFVLIFFSKEFYLVHFGS